MNNGRFRNLLLLCGDIYCLLAALAVGAYANGTPGGLLWCDWPYVLLVMTLACGFTRLYHGNMFYPGAPLPPVEELRRMSFCLALTGGTLAVLNLEALRSGQLSLFVVVLSIGLLFLTVLPVRNVLRHIMKCHGIGQMSVLIAGGGLTGRMVARELDHDCYYGFRFVGFLDDNGGDGVVGMVDEAAECGRKDGCDYLICCLPVSVVDRYLRFFVGDFAHVTVIADNQVFPVSWSYPLDLQTIGGLEFRNQLMLTGPRILKKMLEYVLALVAVLLLWPLFLLLALLVKMDSRGPVFYRAKRLGRDGKSFRMWKFRTMNCDADDQLERILAEQPGMAEEWRSRFKLHNDPRVTGIGYFLRRTSLDELPQLFNVLCGDMAIIGPRPIVAAEIGLYGGRYGLLSRVKPGITGLWQVSGRSEVSYDKRIRQDVYYILNWSVWLDFYILLCTVAEVLRCRGAR